MGSIKKESRRWERAAEQGENRKRQGGETIDEKSQKKTKDQKKG